MNNGIFILLIAITFVACKSDKKNENINVIESSINTKDSLVLEKTESEKFENNLIDYREIDKRFNEELIVDKFGIQIANDSTLAFIFRLNPSSIESAANNYSFAIKGFHNGNDKLFRGTYNPKVNNIGDAKYIQLWQEMIEIKYFDSLQVYIYEKNNWKGSGSLGEIMIKDILIEDKK